MLPMSLMEAWTLKVSFASVPVCRPEEVQVLSVSTSADWFPLGTISSPPSEIPLSHYVYRDMEFQSFLLLTHSHNTLYGGAGGAGALGLGKRFLWTLCSAPAPVSLGSFQFSSPSFPLTFFLFVPSQTPKTAPVLQFSTSFYTDSCAPVLDFHPHQLY